MASAEPTSTTGDDNPEADPKAAAGATKQRSEPTLHDRVREGGDFAIEQIKVRDTKISELGNRVKQYEVIDPYLKASGSADQLLEHASRSLAIQQVAGLSDLVKEAIAAGRLPEAATQTPDDDPNEQWIDEDTKRVRDESRESFKEMKAEIASLRQMAQVTAARSQSTYIKDNIAAVVEMFKNSPEGVKEALDFIEARVGAAQLQAEQGNIAQQEMIAKLGGEEGADVLTFMLMKEGMFKKYGAEIFGAPQQADDPEGNRVRTTDPMSVNPSRPGHTPLPTVPKGPVSKLTARSILSEIQRQRGRSA